MSDEQLEPLSEEIASLLAALPKPAAPAAAAKAAVWARVASSAAAVGVGAGATTASGLVAAKLLIPVIAAAVVVGAGAGVAIDRVVLPQPEPKIVVRVERVEVPVEVQVPVPPAPIEPVVEAPKKKPAAPAPPASAEERHLVEAMRTALIKRDAHAVFELVERHRKSFPKGQLAEERDNLEIQALALDGRTEAARAAARRFTEKYPHSVFPVPDL